MADVSIIETFSRCPVISVHATVTVDASGVIRAVLAHSTALVVAVDVYGLSSVVDVLIILTLSGMAKALASWKIKLIVNM